ncbi:Rab GDP-dissociation inhibitor [Aureococcus anophagefferens]|nr:Rab GDP-dissociation inhibitor [Aureococcus anophagefferens]
MAALEEEDKEPEAPTFSWMPADCVPMADGEYDAIVLHVDRNQYYGADSASLNLSNLFAKFNGGKQPEDRFFEILGQNRDYNIDLIPKCIMACGKLVKILLHTKVTRYLEFKSLDASYVYRSGKVYKVPATGGEALSSSLLGLFEKRRFRQFLVYLQGYDKDKPETHKGKDLTVMTMQQLYDYFSLEKLTQEFVGHAMALQTDDSYLSKPALPTVMAIHLYVYSLDRYGTSPYIYPMYGLGGLPEGFSRLCAIHGGTFMLNRSVDEVLFGADGKAWGIKGGNEVAKAPLILGDPSYFAKHGKCACTGKVARSICFLNHPIPNTNNAESLQIIIPAAQLKRKNDIYIVLVSNSHQPALALGPIMTKFDDCVELYEPTADGTADNCFISKSFDATSHFESSSADVLSLYKRITGADLDLNINADSTKGDY